MHLDRRTLIAAMAASLSLPNGVLADGQISVVTTTGMIADTVQRIGGEKVVVRGLMGPGVDPHAYRQTRSDIVALTRADIVFWHGLYLEAQMEGFFEDLSSQRLVIAAAEGLPSQDLLSHDVYSDKVDPHVWMNPDLWIKVASDLGAAMQTAFPEHAPAFSYNLAAFTEDLQVLSDYASIAMASVPERSRVLVTAHDAFKYFGEAYGFEVVGIQGISTESEAGLNRISQLTDMLVDRKIGSVFVESSVSDRNIRALIEGAAAQGHEVRIGGELYSDAMGEPGTYEGTYIGMIDHNITTIAAALGGSVPEGGMQGLLEIKE